MNAMFALGILCLVPVAYALRESPYRVELLVESIPGVLMLLGSPFLEAAFAPQP